MTTFRRRCAALAAVPRALLLGAAVLSVALLATVPGAPTAAAAVTTRPPATPPGLPADLEPLAGYVGQVSCDPGGKPGTLALARLLTTTYPGTSYGSFRACGTGGRTSEHYDGRAIDWMNSVRDPRQAAQATAVLNWLLGTDTAGRRYATARRLGVMYLIWNNRIWSAYDAAAGWQPYSSCAVHPDRGWDTTCHRDHIHFSLSWAGAMGRTSFWSKRVAATDYGPCRPADLNWAAPYQAANPRRCAAYPPVRPPAGASATLGALTTWSGIVLRSGASGPAVPAVQRALSVPAGPFDARTAAAVTAFQRRHGLAGTGVVDAGTWRALLRALAPPAR
jgi:peptidoglycan hydrolase-like protein with peptidoglycan-binding domain